MAKNTHKDIIYRIWIASDESVIKKSWNEAAALAVGESLGSEQDCKIECLVKTRKAALWLYPDDGGEKWDAQRAIEGDLGADVVPFECFFITATHYEGDIT